MPGREKLILDKLRLAIGLGCRELGRNPSTLTELNQICDLTFVAAVRDGSNARYDARARGHTVAGPSEISAWCNRTGYATVSVLCHVAQFILQCSEIELRSLMAVRMSLTAATISELSARTQEIIYTASDAENARKLLAIGMRAIDPSGFMPYAGFDPRQVTAALLVALALRHALSPGQFVACRINFRCVDEPAPTASVPVFNVGDYSHTHPGVRLPAAACRRT